MNRRAFTLIEVLVVIGIIAVLLSLSLVVLGRARGEGAKVVVLSNLHGLGVSFSQYSSAYGDAMPWAPRNTSLRITPPEEPETSLATDDPWALTYAWPALFHSLAPWGEHYATWVDSPRNRDGPRPWLTRAFGFSPPSYLESRSLMARPEVWSGSPDPADASLFAAVRAGEISFPSSKASHFDDDRAYLRRPERPGDARGVLACDGAAVMRADSSIRAGVQNRLTPDPPRIYHDTPDGVRGRDF